jgi:Carboxypeptidase regulatory-like domain
VKIRRALQPIFWLALSLAIALPARAQSKDQKRAEAQLRTVHGSVLDKEENPVASSVVYLKNLKSQAVKTYIADDSGRYRFSGLDPNVDYEIHAEHDDATSPTRTISNYDSRRDLEVMLKLSRKKATN